MNLARSFFLRLFLITVGLAVTANAQSNRPLGITTLTLGADVSNGIVAPAPGSRVRVPPYEQVRMLVPDGWPHPIQWTKDNKPIAGANGRSYTIPLATTADSGNYNITGAPFPFIATGIALDVFAAGHIGNFSARLELAPGASTQIIGFYVSGTAPKNLLVRAVGPSLKAFGIAKPVAQPRLRFYDSAGKETGFTRVAIAVGMDAFFASVGAFPLTGGDASDYGPFAPGAYTIHVTDQAGQGGTVLVEAYEFSVGPAPLVTIPITPLAPVIVINPGS